MKLHTIFAILFLATVAMCARAAALTIEREAVYYGEQP
jgi:hypothetical protein